MHGNLIVLRPPISRTHSASQIFLSIDDYVIRCRRARCELPVYLLQSRSLLTVLCQVGAGPVGLVGALALAMNGVKVRVLEKLPALAVGQRGAGIQVSTLVY